MTDTSQVRDDLAKFQSLFQGLTDAIHKVIVGQNEVVEGVLTALLAGGHVLLEGVPGIGKTMLVRCLGQALDMSNSRIQFTPDLMPADITGTQVIEEGHKLRFQAGPIHTHLLLADEINRATPKTQSALLEAMQELQVTVAGETRKLPNPFIVIGTQNPIEHEGTYPLPEAQLDRFLFKLIVDYPQEQEYETILERTTGASMPTIQPVSSAEEILAMASLVREVPVPEHARQTAIRLVMATQPGSPHATEQVNRYVMIGSSPRGAQALVLAGKVKALREGRFAVSAGDIESMAANALRHRMLINFEGQGEGVTPDSVISNILG